MRNVRIFLLLILTAFSTLGYAGDSSHYAVIGFSENGKYFAFERYGTYDGSAFPYSEIFFLDVCRNDYVNPPIRLTLEDSEQTEEQVRSSNLIKALAVLIKLKIDTTNKGTSVLTTSTENKIVPFTIGGEEMQLTLNTIETKNQECTDQGTAESMFILSLSRNGTTTILQKDTKVPKTRTCAFGYQIYGVHCYNNSIAVIISYNTPGYEGPNSRQIGVSGCWQ